MSEEFLMMSHVNPAWHIRTFRKDVIGLFCKIKIFQRNHGNPLKIILQSTSTCLKSHTHLYMHVVFHRHVSYFTYRVLIS